MIRMLLFLSGIAFISNHAFSQTELRYEHYTIANGLSNNNCKVIAQDAYGLLWIGTLDGLNCFNGYDFTVYRSRDGDSTSLTDNSINNLLVDKRGTLWVGTNNGLNRYVKDSNTFKRFFFGDEKDNRAGEASFIYCITEDHEGNLWLGTGSGIFVFNPAAETYRVPQFEDDSLRAFAEKGISAICFDGAGKVWLGSPLKGELRLADEKKLSQLPFAPGNAKSLLGSYGIQSIKVDRTGTVWILTPRGLYSYAQEQNLLKCFRNVNNLKDTLFSAITSILEDNRGEVWVSLAGAPPDYTSIAKINPAEGTFRNYPYVDNDDRGLAWRYVLYIFQDRSGIYWVGTSRGLDKLDPLCQQFKLYQQYPDKKYSQYNNVYSIMKDSAAIWLGTDGKGLIRYDLRTHRFDTLADPELSQQVVTSILPLDNGNMLLGILNAGVFLFNSRRNTHQKLVSYPAENADGVYQVSCLARGDSADIWIGWSGGGLMRYDLLRKQSKLYVSRESDPASLGSNQVNALFRDSRGILWIGSADGVVVLDGIPGKGLDRFNPEDETFTHFSYRSDDSTSLSNNNVICIAEDGKGMIWAGTRSGGLNRLDVSTKKFTRYTVEDGLPSNFITGILFDDGNNLWISTHTNGLCFMNQQANEIKLFDVASGLQNPRFNRQSCFKAKDGELFFGGVSGFNSFYPSRLRYNTRPPPVLITDIRINNAPSFSKASSFDLKELKLAYDQSELQFDFVALNFSQTLKNRYAYRLEGYDQDWNFSGAGRTAKYTNLDPGEYHFKVKASNNDGVWNETGASVKLIITPPFWNTPWFYALCFLLFAVIVYLIIHYRTSALHNQKLVLEKTVSTRTQELRMEKEYAEQQKVRAEQSEKFKQQFLANMSHEIRTPMNAVMGMTNLLIDKNPRSDQADYLDGIKKSSDTLLHIINDILDISKIEAGKIELEQIDFSISEVVDQVKQTLNHKAQEKGVQLITDIDPGIHPVVIGDPVRLNQVLLNLAGNAIKFTEKGSVLIEVVTGERGIRFSIIDTGVGIPEDKIQSIFESFTQAHASDTRRFGGTGLGLTISRQLVELMGGKIDIESREGSGSTFSFEINYPVGSAEKMHALQSSEQIDGSVLDGLKILIADDNEYNRTVARDTLKSKADVSITEAVNGKNALEIFVLSDFDIVLMDVQMPVMDGFEATRHIREKFSAPKNKVPVIALTASVIRSDLDKCRQAGMDDYVPKPFKASQLISAIAKLTGREIKFIKAKEAGGDQAVKPVSGIVDLRYLEEFCEGDKAKMQKYIGMFLASAPALSGKVNTAIREDDFEMLANQIHGFKTKWIMMGMNRTKELAMLIELRCRKENVDRNTVAETVTQLLAQLDEAVAELSSMDKDRSL